MAKVEIDCVLDIKAATGEGAVWDVRDAALWWCDIPNGRLYRYDPRAGTNDRFDVGEPLGCLALREQGGLLLALQSGFWFFDPKTGQKQQLVDPEADKPLNRFNDGTTDPRGRFWAGTMKNQGDPEPTGAFYRLDPDLSVTRWKDGIFTTNGQAFSPDGRTYYYSDTNHNVRTIWAADYDLDTGMPSNARVFFDTRTVAGRPDGATVDADGCYWMAGVGGWQVVRLTPAGKVDRIIDLPVERPSKPMFGGERLDELYVTSIATPEPDPKQPQAGGLFKITGLGVQGLPQPRFHG
jgi:L-arabinonolactonase